MKYVEHDYRHLPGTSSASDVQTPLVKQVQASIASLQDHKGVVVIDGPPGAGKTFSVSRAAENADLPCYWLDITGQTSLTTMYGNLYRSITGEFPGKMRQFLLGEEIRQLLSASEALLVIDEAQWAPQQLLRAARSTYDQTDGPFVLVLLGQRLQSTISAREPGLASRTSRFIDASDSSITDLTAKKLLATLGSYHPLFAATEPQVIADLDRWALRNWRRWAQILEAALTLKITTGITEQDAANILKLRGAKLKKAAA